MALILFDPRFVSLSVLLFFIVIYLSVDLPKGIHATNGPSRLLLRPIRSFPIHLQAHSSTSPSPSAQTPPYTQNTNGCACFVYSFTRPTSPPPFHPQPSAIKLSRTINMVKCYKTGHSIRAFDHPTVKAGGRPYQFKKQVCGSVRASTDIRPWHFEFM